MKKRGLVLGLQSLSHCVEAAFDSLIAAAGETFGRHLDVELLADLKRQAVEHVKSANPSHACPWCNQQGCMTCHGTGWVPREVYDRAPRELRGGAA